MKFKGSNGKVCKIELYCVVGHHTQRSKYEWVKMIWNECTENLFLLLHWLCLKNLKKSSSFFPLIVVEDPSDSFIQLRDYVDAVACRKLAAFSPDKLKQGFSEDMVKQAREQRKINKVSRADMQGSMLNLRRVVVMDLRAVNSLMGTFIKQITGSRANSFTTNLVLDNFVQLTMSWLRCFSA